MNKLSLYWPRPGRFIVVAASLALGWLIVSPGNLSGATKAAPTQTAQGVGRLVIVRAANLGPTIVGLKIDGKEVAQISYTRRYDAPIAAGSHVLTVWPVVSYEHARPTDTRINVEPGKTYTFTAKRSDIQIVLK